MTHLAARMSCDVTNVATTLPRAWPYGCWQAEAGMMLLLSSVPACMPACAPSLKRRRAGVAGVQSGSASKYRPSKPGVGGGGKRGQGLLHAATAWRMGCGTLCVRESPSPKGKAPGSTAAASQALLQ